MKTKNDLRLKQWLWMIGVYCISSVVVITACTFLVSAGNMSLENAGVYVVFSMLISGVLSGLLAKNMPIQWASVALGIAILLNATCCLLVFSGITKGFLLQNGALIIGCLSGYFLNKKHDTKRKGKRRHKKYS